MNPAVKRVEFVHKYLDAVFAEDLHAKRVMSLANGALGVMTSASLAVSVIGNPWPRVSIRCGPRLQARGR
jgi:hypothetical protein